MIQANYTIYVCYMFWEKRLLRNNEILGIDLELVINRVGISLSVYYQYIILIF